MKVEARPEGADYQYSTGTSASGEFELTGLKAGSYTLRISRIGFKTATVAAKLNSDRPHEVFSPIALQVGASDCCWNSFEVLPEITGWRIPRGCLFQLDTQQVTCQLEIGHIEPVAPPEPAGPFLLFKSSGDQVNLIPRNGAQIALDQPCQSAVYSERPVVVDGPGLTTNVCLRSPAGNFQGKVSPTLLILSP